MRPGGRSAMTEMSMSPCATSASVRGMGVADSVRTCGVGTTERCSSARCSTPNLCCSSITIKPRRWNWMAELSSECVPMTSCTEPSSSPCSTRDLSAARVLPVSTAAVGAGRPPSRSRCRRASRFFLCCATSTSVGAIRAACQPAAAAASIPRNAMMVLPDPTSPCSRRSMGPPDCRSPRMSSRLSACPAVSSNGSTPRIASTDAASSGPSTSASSPPSPPPSLASRAALRLISSPSCSISSSWNASRRLACFRCAGSGGTCTARIAGSQSISCWRCRMSAGSGSSAHLLVSRALSARGMIFRKSLLLTGLSAAYTGCTAPESSDWLCRAHSAEVRRSTWFFISHLP
mmetsp:Transcript_14679/g.37704  ORF Transcript_14679/g.37704 Transcript_14679/m.37704 type:complete len:347 (+) Transcript_14679:1033-2073(+)